MLCSKDGGTIGSKVNAFNCSISSGNIELLSNRVERFEEQYFIGNDCARSAIVRYMKAINEQQAEDFLLSLSF